MAENQKSELIVRTFDLRSPNPRFPIDLSFPQYTSPLGTIIGEAELASDNLAKIGLRPGQPYLNLHFGSFWQNNQSRKILGTLVVLRAGIPDYLDLLRTLCEPNSTLDGINTLYGETNPKMARFATRVLGWHYVEPTQASVQIDDSTEPEICIFASVPEVRTKIPFLEQLGRGVNRLINLL